MSPPVRIALLGFTPFEAEHLRAALAPEPQSPVVYVLTEDLASSGLALVNADHEPSAAEVQHHQRLHTTVMLGTAPRPGAAAQLSRPFHAGMLRRVLDQLALDTPPVSADVARVQQELARMAGRRLRLNPPRLGGEAGASPLIQGPPAAAGRCALVVDESDVRLRALSQHAAHLGLEWHLARSAPDAIERLQSQRPRWLFIMTGLDSLDGFHTCRLLRHTPLPAGQAPRIVLLLNQDGAVDRLRAQLAGADATLAWPLSAAALAEQLLSDTPVEASAPQRHLAPHGP